MQTREAYRITVTYTLLSRILASTSIGLYRSLENELGFASNNNHFDIFFVDDSGKRISADHVHAVLDIKLFLALANEYFDVEIFKGELRPFESYTAEDRTADFTIPKHGVLQAGILGT